MFAQSDKGVIVKSNQSVVFIRYRNRVVQVQSYTDPVD